MITFATIKPIIKMSRRAAVVIRSRVVIKHPAAVSGNAPSGPGRVELDVDKEVGFVDCVSGVSDDTRFELAAHGGEVGVLGDVNGQN